jgi:hypothetical protein
MCGGYCNKHIVKNPMTNEKKEATIGYLPLTYRTEKFDSAW